MARLTFALFLVFFLTIPRFLLHADLPDKIEEFSYVQLVNEVQKIGGEEGDANPDGKIYNSLKGRFQRHLKGWIARNGKKMYTNMADTCLYLDTGESTTKEEWPSRGMTRSIRGWKWDTDGDISDESVLWSSFKIVQADTVKGFGADTGYTPEKGQYLAWVILSNDDVKAKGLKRWTAFLCCVFQKVNKAWRIVAFGMDPRVLNGTKESIPAWDAPYGDTAVRKPKKPTIVGTPKNAQEMRQKAIETLVTIKANGLSLLAVAKMLRLQTGIEIKLDESFPDEMRSMPIQLEFNEQSLLNVIDLLGALYGFDYDVTTEAIVIKVKK